MLSEDAFHLQSYSKFPKSEKLYHLIIIFFTKTLIIPVKQGLSKLSACYEVYQDFLNSNFKMLN